MTARVRVRPRAAATSGCRSCVTAPRQAFLPLVGSLDPHRDYQPGTIPEPHRTEDVVVPPYLRDVPEVRKDLALYYDEISRLDHYVGDVLAELDRQGIDEIRSSFFSAITAGPFPLQDDAL